MPTRIVNYLIYIKFVRLEGLGTPTQGCVKIVLRDFYKDEIGDQACSECSEPGTVAVVGDDGSNLMLWDVTLCYLVTVSLNCCTFLLFAWNYHWLSVFRNAPKPWTGSEIHAEGLCFGELTKTKGQLMVSYCNIINGNSENILSKWLLFSLFWGIFSTWPPGNFPSNLYIYLGYPTKTLTAHVKILSLCSFLRIYLIIASVYSWMGTGPDQRCSEVREMSRRII